MVESDVQGRAKHIPRHVGVHLFALPIPARP